MLIVDIILIVILASFVVSGSRNGFIETLGNLVGAVIGFLAARAWSPWLGSIVGIILPGRAGIARLIAFVIIFIIVDRLVGFLFKLADTLLKIVTRLPIISSINALLGAIIGFAEGIVLVGSSVYLIITYRLDPSLVAWLTASSVAHWTQIVFTRVLGFLL